MLLLIVILIVVAIILSLIKTRIGMDPLLYNVIIVVIVIGVVLAMLAMFGLIHAPSGLGFPARR